MSYRFEPNRMRAASAAIAAMFPGMARRVPAGLEALLRALSQMSPRDAARWGERLNADELGLLCHYFNRAPTASALLAITALLAHRRDRRCADVARYFLHQLPARADIAAFRQIWLELDIGSLTALESQWIDDFARQTDTPSVLDFACARFRDDALTWDELAQKGQRRTPLITAFADFVFGEGGPTIAKLPPGQAADFAVAYLKAGDDARVLAYLEHSPAEHWRLDFLRQLYTDKGPPDPAARPYYRKLHKARVWSLRRTLFTPETTRSLLSVERQELWRRWLHKVSDWRWTEAGSSARIVIRPLIVTEEADRSVVYLIENANRPIDDIPFDHHWGQRMEETFQEFLDWGLG